MPGVDPYYLTYKSEQVGYHPQVVLAGRRINDSMSQWIAEKLILHLAKLRKQIVGIEVLVLGFTFKENCPDFRNTKVLELVRNLENYGMKVDVVDPYANKNEVLRLHHIILSPEVKKDKKYDAVILAVAHQKFKDLNVCDWLKMLAGSGPFLDLKGIIPRELNPVRI